MISTADSFKIITGDDGTCLESLDGPAGAFSAISMLLKAAETWYKFSIKILYISASSGSERDDMKISAK